MLPSVSPAKRRKILSQSSSERRTIRGAYTELQQKTRANQSQIMDPKSDEFDNLIEEQDVIFEQGNCHILTHL